MQKSPLFSTLGSLQTWLKNISSLLYNINQLLLQVIFHFREIIEFLLFMLFSCKKVHLSQVC